LRLLGWDELSTYVINVRYMRGQRRTEEIAKLRDTLSHLSPAYLALGEIAHVALKRAGITHKTLLTAGTTTVIKTVKEMATSLTNVGLSFGTWHRNTLPTVSVKQLTQLIYPLCIDTVRIAGSSEANEERRARNYRSIDVTASEKTRRLFVTGKCKRISDAMRVVGYRGRGMYDVAKSQGWNAERDEHQRMKTEQYLKADKDHAVLTAKKLRSQAFEAAQLAMENVLSRLKSGDLEPSPAAAKQLADTALSLAGAGVGETSEAQDALASLSLDQLIEKARKSLKQFKPTTPVASS